MNAYRSSPVIAILLCLTFASYYGESTGLDFVLSVRMIEPESSALGVVSVLIKRNRKTSCYYKYSEITAIP